MGIVNKEDRQSAKKRSNSKK